ncbi:HlyD family efflux transporter periplasmic adaptor subunit [Catellatospora methionotrophica]|uniref:HlyD family efflux transporter periplasmic adaptor subunit n=1 Tax=Catellatospora methionotrophica TaxID=121620 RepID=UPI00340D49D9
MTFVVRGRRRRWVAAGAAVLIAVAVVTVVAWQGADPAPAAAATVAVQRGEVTSSVAASGKVSPVATRELAFSVAGTLTAVLVKPGDEVAVGQDLATIDDADAREARDDAANALSEAQQALSDAQDAADTADTSPSCTTARGAASGTTGDGTVTAVTVALLTHPANPDLATTPAVTATATSSTAARPATAANSVTATATSSTAARSATATSSVTPTATSSTAARSATATSSVTATATSSTAARSATATSSVSATATAATTPSPASSPSATPSPSAPGKPSASPKPSAAPSRTPSPSTRPGGCTSGGSSNGGSANGGGAAGGRGGDAIYTAQVAVNKADADLAKAERALAGTTITAPVAAKVLSVGGRAGDPAGTGTFITLGVVATMMVEAEFAEADAVSLAVGQPATVTLANRPDETLPATIAQVAATGTASGTLVRYHVLLAFDGAPEGLLIGQSATAGVVLARAEGLLLPQSAVRVTGDGTGEVKLPDGTARTIGIGLRGDGDVEILSGLTEDEQVRLNARS